MTAGFGLSAGPLDWRFGGEYVLLALRALRDEGIRVRWRVVGIGPDRERLLFGVRDLGLEDQVELVRAPADTFRDHLGSARWALLPWIRDGWSPFASAAVAHGLPTASAAVPGGSGSLGSVNPVVPFIPRDVSSLTDAIRAVAGP